MKPANEYPVGFGYKATADPWYTPTKVQSSNPSLWIGPYHRGNDFYTPLGTPVLINGELVAKTGATGNVGGPHVHVQLSPEGDPSGKEWNYPNAVVTEVNKIGTPNEGKYIKIRSSDGIVRMYFHLSEIYVTVGQVIGGTMPISTDQLYSLVRAMTRREPTQEEVTNQKYLDDPGFAIDTFWNNGGKYSYEHQDQTFKPYSGKQLYTKD